MNYVVHQPDTSVCLLSPFVLFVLYETFSLHCIAIICAMFAFAMMAYFTRQANTDILTIATWRAILVALLFFVCSFQQRTSSSAFKRSQRSITRYNRNRRFNVQRYSTFGTFFERALKISCHMTFWVSHLQHLLEDTP